MKIAFIPDLQIKPNVPLDHLKWIGTYLAEKKPDIIVQIGDAADMHSLSSYDVGTKAFEGRSYREDVEVVKDGMSMLMRPIQEEQLRLVRNRDKRWNPELLLTLGNHEDRINRAINLDRKLDGLISISDLGFDDFGWNVFPFLKVVVREGIAFSHFFTSGVMGRPVTTSQMLLTKKHMSCIAGHQQGRSIAYGRRADGIEMTAIICGSCYQHNEEYLGEQNNTHFRGMYMLHEVKDGSFDEMAVSLDYLRRTYAS